MTPKRPYLLRAIHQWIVDNNGVPHIVVNTNVGGHEGIPKDYIGEDGGIILNISDSATWSLKIDNSQVSFGARFNTVPYDVVVPVSAVTAIYDRNTGAGLLLGEATSPGEKSKPEKKVVEKPYLKLVVNNDEKS